MKTSVIKNSLKYVVLLVFSLDAFAQSQSASVSGLVKEKKQLIHYLS